MNHSWGKKKHITWIVQSASYIWGVFVLKIGLRILTWAPQVPFSVPERRAEEQYRVLFWGIWGNHRKIRNNSRFGGATFWWCKFQWANRKSVQKGKAEKWVDLQNILLQKTNFPETNVQKLSSAPHRLLLPTVDATRGSKYGQNWKGVEGFLKKGSWNKRIVLLGKTKIDGDELNAKKVGKI